MSKNPPKKTANEKAKIILYPGSKTNKIKKPPKPEQAGKIKE